MKEFWDERYASDEYVYGIEPNVFFKTWVDKSNAGKMLLPGEGEGRNAVYAASEGWDVMAFDQSKNARMKALKLAEEKDVKINYKTGSILDVPLEKDSLELIGLVYFHLFPEARTRYHEHLAASLKTGGLIVIEVFSKEQIYNSTGGPKDLNLLYSLGDIIKDFNDMEIVYAANEAVNLNEGPFHQGMADVIRFVGKKI
jgi:hypothetical protein